MDLAEKTGMSVKLVRHYICKYGFEAGADPLEYSSFGERHVKMLSIVKEINKSKYFSQPLATHFINQIGTGSLPGELPAEGAEVLSRVARLVQEVKELADT